jgi:hypothetical protein
MTFEMNNSCAGGLTGSSLGQKASHTRIKSMNSPEWSKLRQELKALNPDEKKVEEDFATISEMLGRLDRTNQPVG